MGAVALSIDIGSECVFTESIRRIVGRTVSGVVFDGVSRLGYMADVVADGTGVFELLVCSFCLVSSHVSAGQTKFLNFGNIANDSVI